MSLYLTSSKHVRSLYSSLSHTQAYVFSVATDRELIIQKHYSKISSYAYKILTVFYIKFGIGQYLVLPKFPFSK